MNLFVIVLITFVAIPSTSIMLTPPDKPFVGLIITPPISFSTNRTTILLEQQKLRLQRKINATGGCKANICFAIDISASVTEEEVRNEGNFILDIVSVLNVSDVEYAATRFTNSSYEISSLTDDRSSFISSVTITTLVDVASGKRVGGLSNAGEGLNYCFTQLKGRRNENNHVVFLGDSVRKVEDTARRNAQLFNEAGGRLSVVASGISDNKVLLDIVGGNKDLVHAVVNFLDVLSLESIIEDVVAEICNL